MKIKINKQGISFIRKTKMGLWTSTYTWIYFNPFYRINKWLRNRLSSKIHKLYPYLQCQGCGEGVIEYSIKDPNKSYGSRTRRWKVCRQCVNFYDEHCSSRKIEFEY